MSCDLKGELKAEFMFLTSNKTSESITSNSGLIALASSIFTFGLKIIVEIKRHQSQWHLMEGLCNSITNSGLGI